MGLRFKTRFDPIVSFLNREVSWIGSPVTPWLQLLLAISAEVIGTSCLKLSEGFSRPGPTLVVLTAYAVSMTLMSRVVQVLPMGLTYALWSGLGIVAIVLIGMVLYQQIPSRGQLIGMALITTGVVLVNFHKGQ